MYKQILLDSIEKEINICKRLYTKIPADKTEFRPKEGLRSILELLRYLTYHAGAMVAYFIKTDDTDFRTFFGSKSADGKTMTYDQFPMFMDEELKRIRAAFDQVTEDDLANKEVTYPWGGNAKLFEGILNTSLKFLTGYKLQLFLYIKLCSEQKLGTPDAWILTEDREQ